MPEVDTEQSWWQYLDARPWWHPLRLLAGVRFNDDRYETRRFGRWHGKTYFADEVFRAKGRVLQLRKLPLSRFAWTHTLWTLRPAPDVDVRTLARSANRTRRDAVRHLNADVAEPPWCFDCGYDRTGLPAGNPCPECGWRPAPGAIYLFPRPGPSGARQHGQSFWTEWQQLLSVALGLTAMAVVFLGPPGFWPLPRFAWTLAFIAAGIAASGVLQRAVRSDDEIPPALARETLRLEPDDNPPLRLRAPGSFETKVSRRRARRLRLERRLPNLYRLRRPLRWYSFGRRFEVYFEAAPKQAARVRDALTRV